MIVEMTNLKLYWDDRY